MMISGDGFFVTSKGGQQLFTRAGAFSPDAAGQLVSPDGGILQGWTAVRRCGQHRRRRSAASH